MYGWLSCDESNKPGEINVCIPEWEPMAALKLTDAQKTERTKRVPAFVN